MTEVPGGQAHGPLLPDAERLLRFVRRMDVVSFARVFRKQLPDADLMKLITALPNDRLDKLTMRARGQFGRQTLPPHTPEDPLAVAIRIARERAGMGQNELAEALGVSQSAVSQWERGPAKPSAPRLVDLMRKLPELAGILNSESARPADEASPTSAGSEREANS